MSESLSNRIKLCSFICTVMVVFRHSNNNQAFFGVNYLDGLNGFIQNLFTNITEIAVPYFFLVSGYFFFKYRYLSIKEYFSMFRRKLRTLFLPLLVWNLIALPLFILSHKEYVWNPFRFFVDLITSQYYAPLWYIRDLLIFMYLAPFYQWLLYCQRKFVIIIVLVVLFVLWKPVDSALCSTEGMFFFFVGGAIQHFNLNIEAGLPKLKLVLLFVTWLVSSFLIGNIDDVWVIKLYMCIGIWGLWEIIPKLGKQCHMLIHWAAYSFFVYVTHFYILKSMKVTIAYFFKGSNLVSCLSYLLLPLITIAIIVLLAMKMKSVSPKLYGLITGGR